MISLPHTSCPFPGRLLLSVQYFGLRPDVAFHKHDIDGLLIVHEAIGKSNTSRVAELTASIDTLRAYGIWEGGLLRRVAAWNSKVRLSDGTASFFNTTLNGAGAIRVSWIKWLGESTTTASFVV